MKKFNWEEFKDKNNKIAVYCKTREEANDFCKQMHEHGMKWKDGDSYLDISCWDRYRDKTCYNNHGGYSSYIFYEEEKYTILEWSDYMKKEFTKADLRDGMVVEYRDGKRRLVVAEMLIGKDGHLTLKPFNENLENINFMEHTIVKIYEIKNSAPFNCVLDDDNLELIWKRNEVKKMTEEEMREKLEELTGEKIEVEPSREEMIGKIKLYCTGKLDCTECILSDICKRCNYWKFEDSKLKQCYEKVMEDGRKES